MNVLRTMLRNQRLAAFVGLVLAAAPALASEPAKENRFDVFEFRVEGNSTLDAAVIEKAVTPFLGEQRTLVDVDGARAALEKAYHDAGWLTVSVVIPEQKVEDGEVALQVIEGKVDRLSVRGAHYHANSDIRATVPELAEGNVPNFPRMQNELAQLNHSPDLQVSPVMTAGSRPGTIDVHLDTEDELPLHGSFEINNRQTPNSTPARLAMNLHYDNLWQLGHSLALTAQVSPQQLGQVSQFGATYVMPFSPGGDALALYAIRSRSQFDTVTGSPGLGVLGNSNIYGIRHALALPALDDFSQSLSYGIDYKYIEQSVNVAGSASQSTPITYVPLAANYTATWQNNSSTSTLEAGTVVGMRGLFGNNDVAFDNKRSGASASFAVFKGSLRDIEKIERWTLDGKIELQLASGPLVNSEQYAAGGVDSVRGYLEGELMGDSALRGSLQLATPALAFGGNASPWHISGVGFFDVARLQTLQAAYPQPSFQLIRGTGVGLRMSAPRGTSLDVDLARALDAGQTTKAGEIRVLARVLVTF